jgi:hypothetical protein
MQQAASTQHITRVNRGLTLCTKFTHSSTQRLADPTVTLPCSFTATTQQPKHQQVRRRLHFCISAALHESSRAYNIARTGLGHPLRYIPSREQSPYTCMTTSASLVNQQDQQAAFLLPSICTTFGWLAPTTFKGLRSCTQILSPSTYKGSPPPTLQKEHQASASMSITGAPPLPQDPLASNPDHHCYLNW